MADAPNPHSGSTFDSWLAEEGFEDLFAEDFNPFKVPVFAMDIIDLELDFIDGVEPGVNYDVDIFNEPTKEWTYDAETLRSLR